MQCRRKVCAAREYRWRSNHDLSILGDIDTGLLIPRCDYINEAGGTWVKINHGARTSASAKELDNKDGALFQVLG